MKLISACVKQFFLYETLMSHHTRRECVVCVDSVPAQQSASACMDIKQLCVMFRVKLFGSGMEELYSFGSSKWMITGLLFIIMSRLFAAERLLKRSLWITSVWRQIKAFVTASWGGGHQYAVDKNWTVDIFTVKTAVLTIRKPQINLRNTRNSS